VLAVAAGSLLLPLAAPLPAAGAQVPPDAPGGPGGPSFEGDAAPPILRPAPPGLRDRLPGALTTGDGAVAAAANPGQGFSLFSSFDVRSFNWGSYRLRLVASPGVDIESFRDELQLAAGRLALVIQAPVTVAPGVLPRPAGDTSLSLRPAVGEIRLVVQTESACGPLSPTAGGVVGCGGPEVFNADPGQPDLLFGGNVWLAPGLAPSGADGIRQAVVEHELGHAFGLNHFDGEWPPGSGLFQLMNSRVRADVATYRAGDANGLGYLQNPAGSFVASTYCDFLDRRVDPSGYRYWVGQLFYIEAPGISTTGYVDQLARSAEYIRNLVARFYLDTLNRAPEATGLAYWTGELQLGRRSVAQVAGQFYGSTEYVARFPTLAAWVVDLYRVRLGRTSATANDQAFWSARARTIGTAAVASEIYQARESLNLRVAALYQEFLRRSPDANGAAFWAPRIAATGDLALARDLAVSAEYVAGAPTFVRSCPGAP
jgi:hypothetical protein